MKNENAIFFFSGTGNSFDITLRLAEKMQNTDVYNIAGIDEISFADHCECCLCCIHACPMEAINYLDKTSGKKRYINPNISIEDMKKYCVADSLNG